MAREYRIQPKSYKAMTGLHLAAYFGVDNAVGALLGSNSRDAKDSYSRSPLLWAALRGHEAVVQLLLDKGTELETKDEEYDQTPLWWAAASGHEVVVKQLLDKGADVPMARSRPIKYWYI